MKCLHLNQARVLVHVPQVQALARQVVQVQAIARQVVQVQVPNLLQVVQAQVLVQVHRVFLLVPNLLQIVRTHQVQTLVLILLVQ